MLLRSGYNTEFSCGAEIWSVNFLRYLSSPKEFKKEVREMRKSEIWSPNFMTPWQPNEFKKEVREMRKRLKKMGCDLE